MSCVWMLANTRNCRYFMIGRVHATLTHIELLVVRFGEVNRDLLCLAVEDRCFSSVWVRSWHVLRFFVHNWLFLFIFCADRFGNYFRLSFWVANILKVNMLILAGNFFHTSWKTFHIWRTDEHVFRTNVRCFNDIYYSLSKFKFNGKIFLQTNIWFQN